MKNWNSSLVPIFSPFPLVFHLSNFRCTLYVTAKYGLIIVSVLSAGLHRQTVFGFRLVFNYFLVDITFTVFVLYSVLIFFLKFTVS